jgi:hypothetical protein
MRRRFQMCLFSLAERRLRLLNRMLSVAMHKNVRDETFRKENFLAHHRILRITTVLILTLGLRL